jgi:hypothetical protein
MCQSHLTAILLDIYNHNRLLLRFKALEESHSQESNQDSIVFSCPIFYIIGVKIKFLHVFGAL